jgi:hypothetical protein
MRVVVRGLFSWCDDVLAMNEVKAAPWWLW